MSIEEIFKISFPGYNLILSEYSEFYLQFTFGNSDYQFFIRIRKHAEDYTIIGGRIAKDGKSYATSFTLAQINKVIALWNNCLPFFSDPTTPVCPECGEYIANCEEGHSSMITEQPEHFKEELMKAEEMYYNNLNL